jgi:hypothetical protein
MASIMEDDKVNTSKVVCKAFFDEKGLTVYFDMAVSEEIKWRPHIFATDHQKLILDILTQETIPSFYIKKYVEIRNLLREVEIYIGLVEDLNYFPDVIAECARNGFGIYKINKTLKLLFEARLPTIEDLSDKGQIAVVFGRPYRNILALKKCLRSCRSYLYWFERNLPKKAFETLFEAIEEGDIQHVETIKLLRGMDDKINESFRDEFLKFKEDIRTHNIESQLRIICDSTVVNRVHGRYIYTEDEQNEPVSIKLPPLNSLKANQWDTILTDTSEIPSFQEYWNSGLDIQNAWNEVRSRVNEYCQRRAPQLEELARVLRARSEPTESS